MQQRRVQTILLILCVYSTIVQLLIFCSEVERHARIIQCGVHNVHCAVHYTASVIGVIFCSDLVASPAGHATLQALRAPHIICTSPNCYHHTEISSFEDIIIYKHHMQVEHTGHAPSIAGTPYNVHVHQLLSSYHHIVRG